MKKIKKVLLLGSGAIKIGEAGEFDYSGSQAIKALKEEGVTVVLVNPNIATIQTSEGMADEVYFLPVTEEFVCRIIEKERPDGILLSFGGQTALNCGIALHTSGTLKKYNVTILGTPIDAILATEDRQLFAKRLNALHLPCAKGEVATTVEDAIAIAFRIGYPVMLRAGFSLGGAGSGVAKDETELWALADKALSLSPQVIIEESLIGWKEIEYEVVRDKDNNCITVCNMENFDPVGIHTGESIVVAPSQTLTNDEYYYLRQKSIDVIRDLKIIGECNIQFALHPDKNELRVIEVNARLSRSSALASKATGYPLAYVAAKLALGKTLPELPNSVTQKTTAFFEPALDYIVVKIPRWDLEKFARVDHRIGSEMKSVGEVMSIGRSFEEAIQKAARMLNDGYMGVIDIRYGNESSDLLLEKIRKPTSMRLFYICSALRAGVSIETIHEITKIDMWFLSHLQRIVQTYHTLVAQKGHMTKNILQEAKQHGFSDRQIGDIIGKKENEIREQRKELGITPFVKQIDTTAGEFPAKTNYLYLTYKATQSDRETNVPAGALAKAGNSRLGVIVLGCGPYAIGTSVEFDWCAVNTVATLRKNKKQAIVINCNPETVSTDYDISDTLYFEELSLERVLDIYDIEQCPVIVSVGGQIANTLAPKLTRCHVPILGTTPQNIEQAEDRNAFSALLDRLSIKQPAWGECRSDEQVLELAATIGYPVLVRPSFVLSGKAMSIVDTPEELSRYLATYPRDISDYPLVMSKFFSRAIECDVDGVAADGSILTSALSEHIEEAGVHSGDSTLVFPAYSISSPLQERIRSESARLVSALQINGPFNVQYLIVDDTPYVIECNLRASRTMPFVSKALKQNFIELATEVLLGTPHKKTKLSHLPYFTVKVSQFSYQKLKGADPVPRIEMTSTGEVAAMGKTVEEAFLKATLATGVRYPIHKAVCVSLGGMEGKVGFLDHCRLLAKMGWTIYATSGTSLFLKEYEIPVSRVGKISDGIHPNVSDLFERHMIDFSVMIPDRTKKKDRTITDGYVIRRMSIDLGIPVIANLHKAALFVKSLEKYSLNDLSIIPWSQYNPGREKD